MGRARVETAGLVTGAVVLLASLLVALGPGSKPLFFDAWYYVELAKSFTSGGSFSVTNFDSPVRGYSFPLVLRGAEELRSLVGLGQVPALRMLNAALLTLVVCVLAPRMVGLAWPDLRFGRWRQIGLAVLLLAFWHGHLESPLTDLPALAAGLTAIVAVGSWRSPWAVALAGVAAAVAVNFRPAYALLVPAIVAIVVWNWREARDGPDAARLLPRLALLLGAIVLVSLPQSLAMQRHHDTWSPLPGAPRELSSRQLTFGLELQRYDTYVADGARHPRLEYSDPAGIRLLQGLRPAEGDRFTAVDVDTYLGLLVEHPVVVAGSMARHLVNGFDARYASPYVEHLDDGSRWPWRVLGFTVIWLALVRLVWPRARHGLGDTRWRYLGALLATCATTLASAMETRFLLPLHLLAYVVVLLPGWPVLLRRPAGSPRGLATALALAASYVVFMGLAWLVVSGASSNLQIPGR